MAYARNYTKMLAESMANTKNVMAGNILRKGMGYIERFDMPIHMKAKSRWQILKWNKHTQKYRVVSEHTTHREAQAIKKLMEGNNHGNS
jgi:hypothetical protein